MAQVKPAKTVKTKPIAQKTGKTGAPKSLDGKKAAQAPTPTKPKKKAGPTQRELRFVKEYLIDLNGTQAWLRVNPGTNEASARVAATRMLAKPNLWSLVEAGMKARAERTELDADRVLLELRRLAFFDIRKIFNGDGSLKKVTDLDDDTAAAIMSVEMIEIGGDGQLMLTKKFKASDKKGALELAMRHLGMLNDKLQLTLPTVLIKDLTGRKDA